MVDAVALFIMYTVYALVNNAGTYIYVGMTETLERRLHEHNAGYCTSTKPHRPFHVLYTETQPTRAEARKREKYLKSGSGKEFLKSLLS